MKFTRQPKVHELIRIGVPLSAIPTYMALSDYADNRSGFCYPRMDTIARTLRIHVRTVQRHLHRLEELGLVQFVKRRRTTSGKFQSWVYRLVLTPLFKKSKATGQRRSSRSNKSQHKRSVTAPHTPQGAEVQSREERAGRRYDGYRWLFGMEAT